MNRVTSYRKLEPVVDGLGYYPPAFRDRLQFDVFTADPIFAGLERNDESSGGRSLRDTAHVCYPHHVFDRRMTMMVPDDSCLREYGFGVHELAHVLDFHLGYAIRCAPVTDYARRNRGEAFAEYVTALLVPGYLDHMRFLWRFARKPYVLADSALADREPLAELRKAGL